MKIKLLVVLVGLLLNSYSFADINDAVITEIWVGRSGADGTQDWIEVTNLGDTAIDTGEIIYDDDKPNTMTGGFLQSFNLEPGESAVFLLDSDADNGTDFDNAGQEFFAVWDLFDFNSKDLGLSAGGGSLSQGGDSANLLNADGLIIDSFIFSTAGTVNTLERTGFGFSEFRESVSGENGAYEASTFNDEDTGMTAVDDQGNPIILVGSPGIFEGFGKVLIGDVNCDGVISLLDVGPFVDAINSNEFNNKADIDRDGSVTLLDVRPFVDLLTNAG